MIKPWKDRVEAAAHFREEDYINDVQYFMQAEIEELRTENARLKAVPMKYKRMAFNAELQAENARLRDALGMMVHAQSSILGLGDSPVVKFARAALGEKS